MNFPYIYDEDIRRLVETAVAEQHPLVPVFEDKENGLQVFQDDALRVLNLLPEESVDLVFADPPYFLSSGGITCQNGQMVSVDKGEWDKPTSLAVTHQFNIDWLRGCRRVLKPNGTLWVSGTMHNIYSVGFALQTLGYKILNDIAWHKVNPPPNLSCRYFTHATETLLWAARDHRSRHTFHYTEMKEDNQGRQMPSLWHITPPRPQEKRHGKHPTQKPEALLTRIVRACSHPGDVVLDPFSGGGTTGTVCARLGRQFIGVEREPEFNIIAIARINDERARLSL